MKPSPSGSQNMVIFRDRLLKTNSDSGINLTFWSLHFSRFHPYLPLHAWAPQGLPTRDLTLLYFGSNHRLCFPSTSVQYSRTLSICSPTCMRNQHQPKSSVANWSCRRLLLEHDCSTLQAPWCLKPEEKASLSGCEWVVFPEISLFLDAFFVKESLWHEFSCLYSKALNGKCLPSRYLPHCADSF